MHLELDRLRAHLNESYTVIRRKGEKPRILKSTEESLGVLQDKPGSLTIVLTPGSISFPGQGFIETHKIYDISGLTVIEPMWDLNGKNVFLGREQAADTHQYDKFTTVINEYPFRRLRRFLKMLTGWKPSPDADTFANQQLELFFERRRQNTLARLNSPKCFNLPPLQEQHGNWREHLQKLSFDSTVDAEVNPDSYYGYYTDEQNMEAARSMIEIAYDAVRNNPHVIGNRPDPNEDEDSEVMVVPLDGKSPEEHGIQNRGIQYLLTDKIYLSMTKTDDRSGKPFQELFLLLEYLEYEERDNTGLVWSISKTIDLCTETHPLGVSMRASEKKDLCLWNNPGLSPEQRPASLEWSSHKITQVSAMLSSILDKLPK